MQARSEALTKVEVVSPNSKDSAGKAQFWALSTSTSLILINYIPSLRLKILYRLSICALQPSPETHSKALLFYSVNTTTMTTSMLWLQTTPPKSRSTLWKTFIQGWLSPTIPNCSLCQATHRRYIANIKIQGTKPPHLHLQACCTFPPPKLLQRQNVIVFKTRMAKTHMKELRTLKTLKW